ncbi:hypothetical protein FACS1894202_00440 [Clostridia bacterium]|nr:hypothetical protein FACS1894202_00440 [Clostridia bacterium]
MRVKLVKSLAGRHKKHIATANSLGLRKIGDLSSEQPDNASTKGKLSQIGYLIQILDN